MQECQATHYRSGGSVFFLRDAHVHVSPRGKKILHLLFPALKSSKFGLKNRIQWAPVCHLHQYNFVILFIYIFILEHLLSTNNKIRWLISHKVQTRSTNTHSRMRWKFSFCAYQRSSGGIAASSMWTFFLLPCAKFQCAPHPLWTKTSAEVRSGSSPFQTGCLWAGGGGVKPPKSRLLYTSFQSKKMLASVPPVCINLNRLNR